MMGCLSFIYTCLRITHKIFFPFFAQEINIAKDILVKPAVARLASAKSRQDGVWDEDGTVAVARLARRACALSQQVSVAFIVNRFRRTQPKDVIRNEYRNR